LFLYYYTRMDINNSISSNGAYKTSTTNDFNMMYGLGDENEADTLNDETFGDCDLKKIQIKSDFGENGEFLGDDAPTELPDFFDTDYSDTNLQSTLNDDINDQAQSIDALLGEDPMRVSIRQSTHNPLFNMAISQARNENIFAPQPNVVQQQQQQQQQRPPPTSRQMVNMQLLKQFELLLISRQVPAHERIVYLQTMIDQMQQQQQQQQSMPRPPPPPPQQQQQQPMPNPNHNGHRPQPPIGGLLEQARLAPMDGSPTPGISSQFLDAIQRSDQLPAQPSSPPVDNHRHNRPARHYPRPPMLNTWQGRGPKHDEFAGMMSDREKQWVVKIQLHQVSQTPEEDFYFQKWSQQTHRTNQTNRHDHRNQKITYPVLQLLKSIQQEKELADRLSQSSVQAVYSNVNPLPYASPLQTQLGKQSVATPKHPRCTLHLDGQFALGKQANSITYGKYHLGVLLHIENIYQDVLQIERQANPSNEFIQNILNRYFHDEKYFFPDLFGCCRKGQIIFERLYRYLITHLPDQLESMFVRLYSSLSYMIRRYSSGFHIENSVMNMINLLQQQICAKRPTLEQILNEIYRSYNEQIKPKILQFDSSSLSFRNNRTIFFTLFFFRCIIKSIF